MTRGRMALAMVGVAMAGAALGGAVGVLFAPASGEETLQGLALRARRGYRSMGRRCGRAFDRVVDLAGKELQAARERAFDTVSKACSR